MASKATVATVAAVVTSLALWIASDSAYGAPCCAPKQWAAEVRLITMETSNGSYTDKKTWHWVSYDFDKQLVAIITFDFWNPDVYQREVLDYRKGMRYITPDEFKCWSSPLKSPLRRLCVPPPGGNISFDFRMLFGFYDERTEKGWFAETIMYQDGGLSGHVTVAAPSCSFVNEMTYAAMDDGKMRWQHTQWTNLTLTVDAENFHMPAACNRSDVTRPLQDGVREMAPLGVLRALWD